MLDYIETIIKVVSPTLAIITVIAVYIKYRKIRFFESRLDVTITPKIYFSGNHAVVKILVQMSNKGNMAIKAIEDKCLFEVKALPSEIESNYLYLNASRLDDIFSSPIYFLIEEYGPHNPKNPYLIEPGVTDVVQVILVVKHHGLFLVRVIFEDIDGYKWFANEIISTTVFENTRNSVDTKSCAAD